MAHRPSVLSAACAAIALVLASAFAAPGAMAAQASALPKVLIIATGGTIASTGNYYHDRGGAVKKISAEALTQAVPGIDKLATLRLEQFSNVTSERIGPTQWLALANRINAAFRDDADLAGVVVTHGTDTMEETAYFLDLTVAGDRPVIVTGSMRPADAIGADGPANLYNAVRAAVAPASRGRGTMVLMDDRLFAASEVTKTNTSRVETFKAPEHGPVAIADHDMLFFQRPRPTQRSIFDISGLKSLPRVDIIYAYAGEDSALIDAALAAGAKGLVIAGAGAGGTTPGMSDGLKRAKKDGVSVVIGSRTGSGRVAGREGRMTAGDLNVQHSRVLLMLALTRSTDKEDVARILAAQTGSEP